jgi:hypothetical protein
MILLKIYGGVNISKIPLDLGADDESHKVAKGQLDTFFKNFDLKSRNIADEWVNSANKDMLKALINDLALPDNVKDMLFSKVNSNWSITRSGLNSFGQLKSSIDSDLSRYKTKNESFDKVFEKLIKDKTWDDDDFKLDLMEVLCVLKSKS